MYSEIVKTKAQVTEELFVDKYTKVNVMNSYGFVVYAIFFDGEFYNIEHYLTGAYLYHSADFRDIKLWLNINV